MEGISLNYKHLHYFWVAAKEGSITAAADRLGIAVQTVSGQIKRLEQSLGKALFAPEGRGLALTEAGRAALGYADQIFLLGGQLQEALAESELDRRLRLTVGISDALPKLLAYRLLSPLLAMAEPLRLVCHEGEFDELLAELALHRLDVVLTDQPAAPSGGLRVFNHGLGESGIEVFAVPALAERHRRGFPASLDGAPLLLPTRHHALRARLDQWFQSHGIRPRIVGEFEDSALLGTFGRAGMGLFPAPSAVREDVGEQYGAQSLGELPGVREQLFAISAQRRIRHPAVEAILASRASGYAS